MNAVCRSRPATEYSSAVVSAVAAHDGVDETDLPPLYDAIDPDALDALLASVQDSGSGRASVDFEYAGHRIVVTEDRTVTVE
jgi:hypothetical protein